MNMAWELEDLPEAIKKKNKEKLQDLKPAAQGPRKTKHGNKGSWIDGFYFRSQLELKYYQELKIRQRAKDIEGFILQPRFILQEATEGQRPITYSADFLVFEKEGKYRVIDTKGFETKEWKRTHKMFKNRYPGIKLEIIK